MANKRNLANFTCNSHPETRKIQYTYQERYSIGIPLPSSHYHAGALTSRELPHSHLNNQIELSLLIQGISLRSRKGM